MNDKHNTVSDPVTKPVRPWIVLLISVLLTPAIAQLIVVTNYEKIPNGEKLADRETLTSNIFMLVWLFVVGSVFFLPNHPMWITYIVGWVAWVIVAWRPQRNHFKALKGTFEYRKVYVWELVASVILAAILISGVKYYVNWIPKVDTTSEQTFKASANAVMKQIYSQDTWTAINASPSYRGTPDYYRRLAVYRHAMHRLLKSDHITSAKYNGWTAEQMIEEARAAYDSGTFK